MSGTASELGWMLAGGGAVLLFVCRRIFGYFSRIPPMAAM